MVFVLAVRIEDSSFVYSAGTELELARRICQKHEPEWSRFVQEYTDKVFFLANTWTKKEKRTEYYSTRSRSGKRYFYTEESVDTWIWVFEQLQKKSCHFKARGKAQFKTYIRVVVASRYLYLDWLEWRYGKTRRSPIALKSLDEVSKRVFTALRRRKSDEVICHDLAISRDQLIIIKDQIFSLLKSKGLLDLIQKPVEVDDSEIISNARSENMGSDEQFDMENFLDAMAKVVSRLEVWERRLLIMFYDLDMSAEQIVEFCKTRGETGMPADRATTLTPRRLYDLLDEIIQKLYLLFTDEQPRLSKELSVDSKSVRMVFQELGVKKFGGSF
jgi:hypothetical protein